MNTDAADAGKLRFAEEASALFERNGMAPMTGRILGWLLVADPPEQGAEAIAEALDASRGSVSMSTRLLMEVGVVERVRVRGERRARYRVRPGVWPAILQQNLRRLTEMRLLAERGLEVMGSVTSPQRDNLVEMRELYAYFEDALPGLVERWDRERRGTDAAPEP